MVLKLQETPHGSNSTHSCYTAVGETYLVVLFSFISRPDEVVFSHLQGITQVIECDNNSHIAVHITQIR